MVTPPTNPITRVYRRYIVEMGIAMVAYCALMVASRRLLYGRLSDAQPWLKVAVAALPVIPVLLVLLAVVRVMRRTDELQRQVYVESLAIAGGATALLAVAYGLIEGDIALDQS